MPVGGHGRYKILVQLVLAVFWARMSQVRASTAFFLLQPAEPGVTDADQSVSLARYERYLGRILACGCSVWALGLDPKP